MIVRSPRPSAPLCNRRAAEVSLARGATMPMPRPKHSSARHAPALALALAVLLGAPPRARAGGFWPTSEPADQHFASELEAALRRSQTPEVLNLLCHAEPGSNALYDAAFRVAMERVPASVPLLLSAIGAVPEEGPLDTLPPHVIDCANRALELLSAASCGGRPYSRYSLSPLDDDTALRLRTSSLAEVLAALGRGDEHERAAVEALVAINAAPCAAGNEAVARATPLLARALARGRYPRHILTLFASGAADPRSAIPAARRYLAVPRYLPLATMALLAMHVEPPNVAPGLGALLDTPQGDEALAALMALPPPRRAAAAPAVLARVAAAHCYGSSDLTRVLLDAARDRRWASTARTGLALIVSSCTDNLAEAALALAAFGDTEQRLLRALLHDVERTVEDRRAFGEAIRATAPDLLDDDEQELLARLIEKDRPPARFDGQFPLQRPSAAERASLALSACRAEAGLPPASLDHPSAAQLDDLEYCLHTHLCGPDEHSYRSTLERCCRAAFPGSRPEVCGGGATARPVSPAVGPAIAPAVATVAAPCAPAPPPPSDRGPTRAPLAVVGLLIAAWLWLRLARAGSVGLRP